MTWRLRAVVDDVMSENPVSQPVIAYVVALNKSERRG